MKLPDPPTSEQHDRLKAELKIIPGFKHLADHLIDGPYRVVAVEKADSPNWQAQVILDTFTPVTAPALSYWDGQQVTTLDLYLLPEFAADLLAWHTEEGTLEVDEDSNSELWPVWPTEEDWADYLAWLISHEDPTSDEVQNLTAAITRLGVGRYLDLAEQLPSHARDKDAFHAVLAAAATD